MSKRDPELERRWRTLVAEWEESGQSARAFCESRQVSPHTFYGWRRELRRRDGQIESSERPTRGRRKRFVEIEVMGSAWLELSLGSDLVLRVPSTVTGDHLAEILSAARKSATC